MYQTGIICPATQSDANAINKFLHNRVLVHRHLDWRKPAEWLGKSPFLIQFSKDDSIIAILNCVPEPKDVFWIRLFACRNNLKEVVFWELLFTKALDIIAEQSQNPTIACLSYQEWMSNLLESQGWQEFEQVIHLKWGGKKERLFSSYHDNSSIRLMTIEDLDQVSFIDNSSFKPIWQQSRDAIGHAFVQSAYATVFEIDHSICGFQISTNENGKAHLARIAVLPDFQRQHIGEQLIINMLLFFNSTRASIITVNTQADNTKSIGLYEKLNFSETKESFPIYTFNQ